MLVLSRKIGESLIIGENIEVKILKIDGNTVKIGIIAPANVKIYRQEIYKHVANQNKESIKGEKSDMSNVQILKEVLKNVHKNRR
ncbi:MAG: carbon storage regulator CsrA [Fervidobacterium sp.]